MILKSLKDVPITSTSRNPELLKQAMIVNGEIPHLTNFAKVVFKPGQVDPEHFHEDMYEIIFVQKGKGVIKINKKVSKIETFSLVVVDPKEKHSIKNNSNSDLILYCLGIKN